MKLSNIKRLRNLERSKRKAPAHEQGISPVKTQTANLRGAYNLNFVSNAELTTYSRGNTPHMQPVDEWAFMPIDKSDSIAKAVSGDAPTHDPIPCTGARVTSTSTYFQLSLDGAIIRAEIEVTAVNKDSLQEQAKSLKHVDTADGAYWPPELLTKAGKPTRSAAAYMKYFNRLESEGWTVDSEEFRKRHFSRKG